MKRRKLILGLLVIIIIVTTIVGYNYVFNPSERDITSEEAITSISALEVQQQFMNNESQANSKYLDQTLMIKGTISHIQNNEITLNDKALIALATMPEESLSEGMKIAVKGRCLGFDELLELVKIDQATIQPLNQTP